MDRYSSLLSTEPDSSLIVDEKRLISKCCFLARHCTLFQLRLDQNSTNSTVLIANQNALNDADDLLLQILRISRPQLELNYLVEKKYNALMDEK